MILGQFSILPSETFNTFPQGNPLLRPEAHIYIHTQVFNLKVRIPRPGEDLDGEGLVSSHFILWTLEQGTYPLNALLVSDVRGRDRPAAAASNRLRNSVQSLKQGHVKRLLGGVELWSEHSRNTELLLSNKGLTCQHTSSRACNPICTADPTPQPHNAGVIYTLAHAYMATHSNITFGILSPQHQEALATCTLAR